MNGLLALAGLAAKFWWWSLQEALLVCGFHNHRR